MSSEEPVGVPGHVGKSEWSKRLQEWLRDCGLSFEAEGEATRVMLEGFILEVAEAGEDKYSVVISVTLPVTGRDATREAGAVASALAIAGRVAGERSIAYELDSSLPSYPMLYITVEFDDPWSLAESIIEALKDRCRKR